MLLDSTGLAPRKFCGHSNPAAPDVGDKTLDVDPMDDEKNSGEPPPPALPLPALPLPTPPSATGTSSGPPSTTRVPSGGNKAVAWAGGAPVDDREVVGDGESDDSSDKSVGDATPPSEVA